MKKLLIIFLIFSALSVSAGSAHFNAINSDAKTVYDGISDDDSSFAMSNAKKYESIIQKYSVEFNVNPDLIRAVIQSEISFRQDITNNEGSFYSYGLMQLSEPKINELKNIFGDDWKTTGSWKDPEKNIKGGTKVIADLAKEVEAMNCPGLNEKFHFSDTAKIDWV